MGDPVIHPNTDMRYGNWTGAGYSAAGESPPFVPYTDEQKNVGSTDSFDEASKQHDLAYDRAQQRLLDDLTTSRPRVDALRDYYTAVSRADQLFVDAAGNVTADHAWGEGIRGVGMTVMAVKRDMQMAVVERLQADPAYRSQIESLSFDATAIANARVAYQNAQSDSERQQAKAQLVLCPRHRS